jgi:hypothetical protein
MNTSINVKLYLKTLNVFLQAYILVYLLFCILYY